MTIKELLVKYSNSVESLIALIQSITHAELNFIPKREDDWSINQHIIHIVFCESESFSRILLMNSIPKSINTVQDTKYWIKNIPTEYIDKETAIGLLENQKKLTLSILQIETNSNLSNKNITCFYNNENITVTLQENIESSIEHIDFHINYINRIKLEYQETI